MSTSLDLSKLSLMDALDLAILIEEEAHQRYKLFASQIGRTGSSNDPGAFFASMAENEAKHGNELLARRIALFGKTPMKVKLIDLFDVEAPEVGVPRRGARL
jgi:rubrerythrin